jgi:hypothetical protein
VIEDYLHGSSSSDVGSGSDLEAGIEAYFSSDLLNDVEQEGELRSDNYIGGGSESTTVE